MFENLIEDVQITTKAYNTACAKYQTRRSVLEAAMNAELKSEFGPELTATKNAQLAAEIALKVAKNAQYVKDAEKRLPFPVGTRVVQWTAVRNYSPNRRVAYRLTGTVGVIEIIDENSRHPESTSDWRHSSFGDTVIRLLLKNGSPGKKYIPCPNFKDNWCEWAEEGVDLNVVRNAVEIAREKEEAEAKRAQEETKRTAMCEVFGL